MFSVIPTIQYGPQVFSTIEGTAITLPCRGSGVPPPDITWTKVFLKRAKVGEGPPYLQWCSCHRRPNCLFINYKIVKGRFKEIKSI